MNWDVITIIDYVVGGGLQVLLLLCIAILGYQGLMVVLNKLRDLLDERESRRWYGD